MCLIFWGGGDFDTSNSAPLLCPYCLLPAFPDTLASMIPTCVFSNFDSSRYKMKDIIKNFEFKQVEMALQ